MDKERFLKDIGKRLKELRGDRTFLERKGRRRHISIMRLDGGWFHPMYCGV